MYKLYKTLAGKEFVIRIADNACIPFEPDNADYQAYLAWVEQGNTPEGATE